MPSMLTAHRDNARCAIFTFVGILVAFGFLFYGIILLGAFEGGGHHRTASAHHHHHSPSVPSEAECAGDSECPVSQHNCWAHRCLQTHDEGRHCVMILTNQFNCTGTE